MTKKRSFAGYIPIVDNGYLRAIDSAAADDVCIFDREVTEQAAPYIRKEIRALEPVTTAKILAGLGYSARVLSFEDVAALFSDADRHVTLIDDDISRATVARLPEARAAMDFVAPALRWNRQNSTTNQDVTPDAVVHSTYLDELFADLYAEADKSTDWWRHVAAATVAKNGRVLSIHHNQSLPHDQTVNMYGDPRVLANRGSDIDLSLFIHAEANCIAHAAQQGDKLEGGSIYVTTFPCPNCAKLIVSSGIKQVYYSEGYAMLDGQTVLQESGVEIIYVQTESEPRSNETRLVPYPEKN